MGLGIIEMVLVSGITVTLLLTVGVLVGNKTTLLIISKFGVHITCGKRYIDYWVAKSINPDVVGWLEVPSVCYAPVMGGLVERYRDYDLNGNEKLEGELYISEGVSALELRKIANKTKENYSIPDLAIIQGTTISLSRSMRNVQFTHFKKYIKTDLRKVYPDIYLIDNGKVRIFELLCATELGIEKNVPITYTDRETFIGAMREKAFFDSEKMYEQDQDIIILKGSSDIDTLLVLLVEKGVKQ